MTDAPTGFVPSPGGYLPLAHPDALAHLAQQQSVFADRLSTTDLAAPVPTCPGWTVLQLAHHLGSVHRWAAGAVREGRPIDLEETGPTDPAELVGWYREGADGLTALLTATDEAAEVWSFGPKPRTARFWGRRQAHETAMHADDLRLAAGAPDAGLAADLALDGVDEVATMFFPRQVRLERIAPLARSLALAPDEADGARWLLAGDGGDPSAAAEATLRGPALVILRALWRRLTLDEALASGATLDGDRSAAQAVLSAGLTP